MSIINEKYEKIGADKDFLLDKVILSQAWKKSHTYMRRHNWYADVLELDLSTLDLENKLDSWIKDLTDEDFQTNDLRVVLAPKSHEWEFEEESPEVEGFDLWSPVQMGGNELELRPLAHIGIRDQTFATAVMICLADIIETKQGRTDQTDFFLAQKLGVFNYGNRLQCVWEEGKDGQQKAKFSWGNSTSYRKYFEDYRLFLQRPIQICQHYSSISSSDNKLFIVSLDISKFFDRIDRNALVTILQELSGLEVTTANKTDHFWKKTGKILNWQWSESSRSVIEKNELGIPDGLPQGLVASGFFANAYMIPFDQRMGKLINKKPKETRQKFLIHDYCRYVDDVRLVVEITDDETSVETLKKNITGLVNDILKIHELNYQAMKSLQVHDKKTKVESFEKLSFQKSTSSIMEMIQNTLSGTPDINGLRQAFGGLEGLLKLSEQFKDIEAKKINRLALSSIASSVMDVSDDTIKRFASGRMLKALRMERSRTNLNEVVRDSNTFEKLTRGEILDHEFEVAARKLIYYWSMNPSLIPLLKCGLNLFPDQKIIGPILQALKIKLSFKEREEDADRLKEIKIIKFIAADLLFSSTTYLGYDNESLYPDTADINRFRAELGAFARWILAQQTFPWYLEQSAALYLISIGDYSFPIASMDDGTKSYHLLQESAKYEVKMEAAYTDRLATALIIQQIRPDTDQFINWFIDWVSSIKSENDRKSIYSTLFKNRPDLLRKLYHLKKDSYLLEDFLADDEIDAEIKKFLNSFPESEFQLINDTPISLLKIIQSDDNPFCQENGLLLLMRAILDNEGKAREKLTKGLMVADIMVTCLNWADIQNPDKSTILKVEFTDFQENREKLFPSWIEKGNEWLYAFGRILRMCATGEHDYTASNYFIREDVGGYKGIKSTPFSRSFGLNNSSAGLFKEPSPLTPWLNILIMKMLQWPGTLRGDFRYNEDLEIEDVKQLYNIVKDRLKYQSKVYGKLSKTPTYIIPVKMYRNQKRGELRVALVQTLMPKVNDINIKDPSNWSPDFRNKHRNHLATICHLVSSQLNTTCSAHDSDKEQYIDLIVFPELSVHPDDIVLLERLSDQTKANIFAGLTFIENTKRKNKYMNQAFWLLRDEKQSGRKFTYVHQGKGYITADEAAMKIEGYRPYQVIVEFENEGNQKIRVAGAICYDATDLALAADLREISDVFVVAAMNKDIQTFDNMVAALQYHMYQPVILANSGEFGGSTAQAPFTKHDNLIAHLHGNQQVGVSIFNVDATVFKRKKRKKSISKQVKTHPAGYEGRDW